MDTMLLRKRTGTKKMVKEQFKSQRSQVPLGKKLGTRDIKCKKDYNRAAYKKAARCFND